MEVWKTIEDSPGYEVSNLTRVRNKKTGRIMKQKISTCGYLQVHLTENGKDKHRSVHRLVAQAFIPNPNGYKEVNHRNEIKTDCRIENLEWCDRKYNVNYGTRNERAARPIPVYCVELDRIFPSETIAGIELNISSCHISCCCKGKRKTCGGYHWRYADREKSS